MQLLPRNPSTPKPENAQVIRVEKNPGVVPEAYMEIR